jgi:hypothetical protein
MNPTEYSRHFDELVADLSISGELFREVLLWALVEERIERLTPLKGELAKMRTARDGISLYWEFVEAKTGRSWKSDCILAYWERVCKDSTKHQRAPITLKDRVRLFFTSPQICRYCKRGPPEVELQLDHREPVARGGSSRYSNLQFLCGFHNQEKGAKLTGEDYLARYLC